MSSLSPTVCVRAALVVTIAGLVGITSLLGQPEKKDPPQPRVDERNLDRYGMRVPRWLWTDQRRSAVIDEATRIDIERDMILLSIAVKSNQPKPDLLKKEAELAQKLASKLALHDLVADATMVTHAPEKLKLAVQIDPTFDIQAQKTLVEATKLFLEYALDDDIIKTSLAEAISDPTPMPKKYVIKDGEEVTDKFGNKLFTEEYKLYLRDRQRPDDAESFKAHMRSALCRTDGDAALLVISRFTGGAWWGTGHLDFFNDPIQRLRHRAPDEGYLYIALNSDRMKDKDADPNWNDAAFWASKIAHECLHNLGYNHPVYTDPKQRDENNKGNAKAFIVAYEFAMLERIRKAKKK